MVTFIFQGLQILLLIFLSYEDWRTKQVSLLQLLAFTGLTIGGLSYLNFPLNYQMTAFILGFLILVKIGGLIAYDKNLMGNGDLVLLMPLLASLHLSELPLFLIGAGLAGIFTAKIKQERSVPFVPSLSFAYLMILVLRLF